MILNFQKLLLLILLAVVSLGLTQIQHKKNIFNETLLLCCDDGVCNTNSLCSRSTAGAIWNGGTCARETPMTCRQCIDYQEDDRLCDQVGVNTGCKMDNGLYYMASNYHVFEIRPTQIENLNENDPPLDPQGGWITINGSPFASYHEDLYTGTQMTISVQLKWDANACVYRFSRWSDGNTNNSRTISVNSNILLYAIYVYDDC